MAEQFINRENASSLRRFTSLEKKRSTAKIDPKMRKPPYQQDTTAFNYGAESGT